MFRAGVYGLSPRIARAPRFYDALPEPRAIGDFGLPISLHLRAPLVIRHGLPEGFGS